jgi:ketosteroid isomerase-like protein
MLVHRCHTWKPWRCPHAGQDEILRAMSQENVEVVRRSCEAFVAGDAETAMAALDSQIEWHATVGGIDEGRIARGHEEVVQAFIDYFEVWERLCRLLARSRQR